MFQLLYNQSDDYLVTVAATIALSLLYAIQHCTAYFANYFRVLDQKFFYCKQTCLNGNRFEMKCFEQNVTIENYGE